jgi:hypothetical protein
VHYGRTDYRAMLGRCPGMDGEEQLFDPKHPVWRIILVAILGLLVLGGVDITDTLVGILGG